MSLGGCASAKAERHTYDVLHCKHGMIRHAFMIARRVRVSRGCVEAVVDKAVGYTVQPGPDVGSVHRR